MKKLLLAIAVLLPDVAHAASATVSVTPETIQQYDVQVSIETIPQTVKEGHKPVRVTGHRYQITITSEKLDLKTCEVALLIKKGEDSYLFTSLQKNPIGLKDNIIYCDVTFSPDFADKAFLIFSEFRDGASSYKLNIKEFAEFSASPSKAPGRPKQATRASRADAPKQPLPEIEAAGEAPWLQFRVTHADLGKISADRCAFVFPKDVVVPDSECFAMKNGYLFVAKEMLYITDRAGKLVVEHKLPNPSVRGPIYRGDDWFGYCDNTNRLGLFHADGKRFGTVAVPNPCMPVVSRDGSRVFFLRTLDPDLIRLQGPIVVDVRNGKILKEHQFGFGGAMARGYLAPTKDGFVAEERSSDALICFDSDGEVAWRSPLAAWRQSQPAGEYVVSVDRKGEEPALKVLDGKGQTVLEKPAASTGCVRLLADGERLLLMRHENDQTVRQLYRLKDGRRLWSVPVPAASRSDNCDYACLSPDGARLASFTRNLYSKGPVIDEDARATFTVTVLDLTTGAELQRQELPFREKLPCFRQPRWTDARTIELIPADYLYRIRLRF